MTSPAVDFDAPAVIDGPYRYSLTRGGWMPGGPPLVFVMLNPSTADAEKDDQTIARCRNRAIRGARVQFGRLVVVNLFALRARNPAELKDHPDPVGPGNDEWITAAARLPGAVVVAAWGGGPAPRLRHRDLDVLDLLDGADLWCLGRTADGAPRHPLFVPRTAPLRRFRLEVPRAAS